MDSFIERLAAGSTGTKVAGAADIRPALTPGMIPEALRLPREGRSPPRPPSPVEDVPGSVPEPTELTSLDTAPSEEEVAPVSPGGNEREGKVTASEQDTEGRNPPRDPRPKVPADVKTGAGALGTTGSAKAAPDGQARKEEVAAEPPVFAGDVRTAGEEARQGKSPSAPQQAGREFRGVRPTPRAGPGTTRAETSGGESPAAPQAEVVSSPAPLRARLEVNEAANQEPTVTINIGRIEVRAVNPEPPPTDERGPALSLDEYMKRRNKRAE